MKLITPSYEIVQQKPGVEGMYKQIELCGRISHKSEDKITDTSYKKFIDMMRKLQHYATFEHGTVYLFVSKDDECRSKMLEFYYHQKYSKLFRDPDGNLYITTNYRVIVENNRGADMQYLCEPTEYHYKRITVIFTCDIGVSREYNRHRVDSILEESTRYCNYASEKHGGELNIMIPIWLEEKRKDIDNLLNEGFNFMDYCKYMAHDREDEFSDFDYWMMANLCAEHCYTKLIELGWTAQQARTVLPLDTKTTLAHTAFESDWQHFFDLRARGTTGDPHPSAKQLAEQLMKEFENILN